MNGVKHLSAKTLNALLIFLIVATFLAVLFVCYRSLVQIDTDEYWEIHSYQVQGNLDVLISDLENMETGERGYVITGQEAFLQPYTAALPDVATRLLTLRTLTADNATQQKNLTAITPLIAAKLADLQNLISLRTGKGFSAAQAEILTDKGKQSMDAIRGVVADMQTEEAGLLLARTNDLAKTNAAAESIILWGGIFGFLLSLLVSYIIYVFVIGEIVRKPFLEKEKKAAFYARSLIEASLDPLITISEKGKITDTNEAMIKATGVPRDKIIGTDFLNYFTDPQKAREGYEKVFQQGSVVDYPLTIQSSDGKHIDVLFNAALYKDEKGIVLGVFAAARDYTKIKKANELTELANKELKSLDLAKDEFVSIASHQLRTPLTALKGYTGMLLDEDPGPINDKQREYLGEIKGANDRMIGLITALLNVSRVDLGVFVVEPEPINLGEVAESVLKELKGNSDAKKLRVTTDFEKDLPLLNADPKIIRMVFQNLLSNAVKYTPPEGTISLVIKKNPPMMLISVTDTGYGIPDDVQQKIFTKMFRADNARTKDPNGTGLGLYIIKATVEQTGGKIWFESKENKGSTFYVSLPLEGMKKKEGSKRLE
jgi:PAS domain S-box-containing protein